MRILITGGCGFIGSNLADAMASDGHEIVLFDNLSRPRTEHNLEWLRARHKVVLLKEDVREYPAVRSAVAGADAVFHLAAQVAVTTSVIRPREDFEINALGTLNVLEAARESHRPPAVIYASTNKVFGSLEGLETVEEPRRYACPDLPKGVPESWPLDFHSPYGCSKGAADQYVRDYSRIYGIKSVVFRQSCIYGPRQFGVEDQGWLAHFLIAAHTGKQITIYGNGKQVRDALHVSDLVALYRLALSDIDRLAGEVFNVGGGPGNTISVWAEFGDLLAELSGSRIDVERSDWRPGDQPWFVADIRELERRIGWKPRVSVSEGVRNLNDWIAENRRLF